MENILPLSLKLNFTSNSLGCYGLKSIIGFSERMLILMNKDRWLSKLKNSRKKVSQKAHKNKQGIIYLILYNLLDRLYV